MGRREKEQSEPGKNGTHRSTHRDKPSKNKTGERLRRKKEEHDITC